MALCEKKISDCIAADCENPIYTGIDAKAWLFNKEDVNITFDQNNPNIVTDITTVGTSTGYTVTQFGKTPYSGTATTMVEGNAANKFTNTFMFIVPDNSHTASNRVIDNLANGSFVAVINNDYAGSDNQSKLQVYGAKKALKASAIDNDKYSEDTDGGWQITLVEENTPVSGVFLVPTSLGTATMDKAFIDSYMSAIAPDCAQ